MTDTTKIHKKRGRPPGFVGSVNRDIDYRCMACGETFERDQLRVKRAVFSMMGTKGRFIRSRTLGWLCVPCMTADEDYNKPPANKKEDT